MKKLNVEKMESIEGGCGARVLGAFLLGFFAGGILIGVIAASIVGLTDREIAFKEKEITK